MSEEFDKDYTVVCQRMDYGKKYARCYYWEEKERKYDEFEIENESFLFVDEDEEVDSKYKIERGFTNIYGMKVKKVIPNKTLKKDEYEEFKGQFELTYEGDVRPIERWMWIHKPKFTKKIRTCYIDIEVMRNDLGQYSSVIDAKNKINAITVYDNFNDEYYVFFLSKENKKFSKGNKKFFFLSSETKLLEKFLEYVEKCNPDYFTGWNAVEFDMAYLVNRMRNLKMDYQKLSPLNFVMINMKGTPIIQGRGCIDLMELSKQMWTGTDCGYSLNAQSKKFLGEGKIEIDDLDECYRKDPDKFAEYNIKDVELCIKLDKKNNLISAFQEFQDVISINLHDTVVAGKLINSNWKQHTNVVLDATREKATYRIPGGFVYDNVVGIYDNARKFDLTSSYPAGIITRNISPDSVVMNPTEEQKKDLIHFSAYYKWFGSGDKKSARILTRESEIRANKDAEFFEIWFKKEPGIITVEMEKLFNTRIKVKKTNKPRANVLKRMMNSVYGQYKYKYSRMFFIDGGITITLSGQKANKGVIDIIEDGDEKFPNGYGEVLMGDTDSFMCTLKEGITSDMVLEMSRKYLEKIAKEDNCDKNYVKFELEDKIDRVILFGTKKKYAERIGDKIKIVGMECIKKDTIQATKELQLELINYILFTDKPQVSEFEAIKQKYIQKIYKAIRDKDFKYFAVPTVIKKPIVEYENNTAEKKGLRNSGLSVSPSEQFYLFCIKDNDWYAFKNNSDVDLTKTKINTMRSIERAFSNINIFDKLFYKQKTLGDF